MAKENNMDKEKKTIQIHKEELNISKKLVEKGKINIHKTVKTETVSNSIPLVQENVRIEHVIINKEVTEIPKIRKEGDVTIIPIIEEVAVVTKKIMLVKELHITKERTEKMEHIETALRSESVTIEKKNKANSK